MFKKLKDKIAEEVKQSPLKSVQQLAQAVVSPNSSSVFEPSSSNDKFCIEEGDIEEDEKQDQAKPGGFTSVTLTGQTSSPIRDQTQKYGFRSSSGSLKAEADTLFPKFEPQATNFHVQSDWESASEVEDRYSQLEHINKESLYEAYRKVYNRYNRIKNKYHEVVTHYRQLEREKEKAKTVLTETQDKALLRISELREQCLLEQQAKAHLEEALRNELEERDHIINTLKTKVQYLKGVGDSSMTESLDDSILSKEEGNLIDFTENSSVSTVPLPFDASNCEEKVNWFDKKLKSLKDLLNEETSKVEQLKNRLQEVSDQNCDLEDLISEKVNSENSMLKEQTQNDLDKKLSELITKLSLEVQILQKNAVNCSLLKSASDKPNLGFKLNSKNSENRLGINKVSDVGKEELDGYTTIIKELEEQNKSLSQRLNEESSSSVDLKHDLNSHKITMDALRRKIKLSNENFGKNDAINCLITDIENELIKEWNLCFQNFLQTRCEITVLKDTKEDLEKELFRIREEKNKFENMNKEITEQHNKLKENIEIHQKDLKSYLFQIESLAKENNDLKVSNETLEKQIKKLEETLSQNEKADSERHEALQKIANEKSDIETKLSKLELKLKDVQSEYSLLLEAKQKVDTEILSLKKENGDVMAEKESLNNKLNEMENKLKEMENKLKEVEGGNKLMVDTRDELDNEINSLTKLTEELTSEKNGSLIKISNLEKDLEGKMLEISKLHGERDKLLGEIEHFKNEYKIVNNEKLSVTDQLNNLAKELEKNQEDYTQKFLETAQKNLENTRALKMERDQLIEEKCILESKIENLVKDINKYKSNYNEASQNQEILTEELSSVKEERDSLISEIQSIQNQIVELTAVSKSANEELLVFKKENADLMSENSKMQEEIQRLQSCLQTNAEQNSSSSETNMKLSHELETLMKERGDLIREKDIMENLSKKLDHELSTSKEELSALTEEYSKISDKLQTLQKENEDLVLDKQVKENTIDKLKKELKQKEEMLLSVSEKGKFSSEENEMLKDKFNQIEKQYKSLKDEYNMVVAEIERAKSELSSLSEMNNKLSEENNYLKNDSKSIHTLLNDTKLQLEKKQNDMSELSDELCSLSFSLDEKRKEVNKKDDENLCLKDKVNKLTEEVEFLACCIEKHSKEKKVLINFLLSNLNNLKIIKELQKNLIDFVKQFQVEVSHEINDINLKMGQDLLKHLNDLLYQDKFNSKLNEVDCKTKEDIDSYNSKLKNLQGLSKISEEALQIKASALENAYPVENETDSKMVRFSQMGHLEKLSEQDSCYSYDPEAYLKQAVSLMKSFTNLLNHNSVNSDYSVDMFTSENEKFIKLNEIEGKNLQKEIVAMELFITDCENRYSKTNLPSFNIPNSSKSNSITEHTSKEIQKLQQEISLKDDIIKKLQSVIEEYEQKVDVDDSEFIYKQKILLLEQENNSLTNKLQQLQETHELNVKNIVSEYEKKLEEVEEESNLYDFEKLGKEKNFVVNEMKEQIQNLQQDLEERGDAFEKLYEEHQQNVKSFDEQVHTMRSNHDKELREQDKKWRQCLDRRLAEEEARHQQELASLNMQWNAERRELETARRLAVNAVESGSGSNELLRRQVQALTMQLSELRNTRCEACERKMKTELGQDHRPRSFQDCTEMEYLRNILYEYMMGKEPLILAKVLCALVKFDENQTKEIVAKEEHRITLLRTPKTK